VVPHFKTALARCTLLLLFGSATAQAGTTLDRIRQTGILRCGINQEIAEYSTSDDHGALEAFDSDICKAVAVAILGPKAQVVATGYPDDVASMEALRSGAVDLLPTLTLDLTHSTEPGILFSRPVLYDGVGFLVPLSAKVSLANQLSGKKICFLAETEVEVALRAWYAKQHLKFVPFPFQEEGEMEAAFVTGNCTALAGDLTRLAATRVAFGPLAARFTLLPELVSKDPLAAASPENDPQFARVVDWTLEILLQAEESGLTQHNIATAPANSDSTVEILTGRTREIGSRLGLDDTWALRVIAAVGNYAEIYERDLGSQSPLNLPRGLNRLSTDGGLMYSLPLK